MIIEGQIKLTIILKKILRKELFILNIINVMYEVMKYRVFEIVETFERNLEDLILSYSSIV